MRLFWLYRCQLQCVVKGCVWHFFLKSGYIWFPAAKNRALPPPRNHWIGIEIGIKIAKNKSKLSFIVLKSCPDVNFDYSALAIANDYRGFLYKSCAKWQRSKDIESAKKPPQTDLLSFNNLLHLCFTSLFYLSFLFGFIFHPLFIIIKNRLEIRTFRALSSIELYLRSILLIVVLFCLHFCNFSIEFLFFVQKFSKMSLNYLQLLLLGKE